MIIQKYFKGQWAELIQL